GSSCTPPVETCNGMDDSCDGTADEGLAIEGSASAVASGPGLRSPHIIPFGTGYVVFYTSNAAGRTLTMQQLTNAGALVGSAVPLGVSVAPTTIGFSARASGTHIFVAWSDGTN